MVARSRCTNFSILIRDCPPFRMMMLVFFHKNKSIRRIRLSMPINFVYDIVLVIVPTEQKKTGEISFVLTLKNALILTDSLAVSEAVLFIEEKTGRLTAQPLFYSTGLGRMIAAIRSGILMSCSIAYCTHAAQTKTY